jgi:hypothetical protein
VVKTIEATIAQAKAELAGKPSPIEPAARAA